MDSNVFFAKALHRDLCSCHIGHGGAWEFKHRVARVFAWRAEIDLADISQAYHRLYQLSLEKSIRKSVKGNAGDALLGILQKMY